MSSFAAADSLVVGGGYLGLRVAQAWLAKGRRVCVVTRSPDRAVQLAAQGYCPLVADVTGNPGWQSIPSVRSVLFAVGYDRTAGHAIGEVYVNGLARVLDALPASVERFIYTSSTGVYGDVEGEWVDEETPCRPTREGGRACLAAEQTLRQHRLGERTIILRLAGIYGPGRIPRAEALRAGRAIDAPADGYLNLIHVDDATRIVLAAEASLSPPRLYVVSDGKPCVRREYYAELARLLSAPPPVFTAPAAGSPEAQRAASDKRIRPARLFADLDVELRFPSYREGLAAIVKSP